MRPPTWGAIMAKSKFYKQNRLALRLLPVAVFVIPALILLFLGMRQLYLRWDATPEPEPMTLAKLLARGAWGNPNVSVSEFGVGDWVVEQRDSKSAFTTLYVPLVPASKQPTDQMSQAPVREMAILITGSTHPNELLAEVAEWGELPCTVMDRVEWLPTEVRSQLNGHYKGAAFPRIILLRPGSVFDWTTIWWLLGIGGALLVPASIFGFFAWKEFQAQKSVKYDVDEALRDVPQRPVPLPLPEDHLLFQLRAFRRDGGASEEKWREIVEAFRQRRGQLDEDYLDRWAADLQVMDLLDRARQQSRSSF
jgi:hypothetical protein